MLKYGLLGMYLFLVQNSELLHADEQRDFCPFKKSFIQSMKIWFKNTVFQNNYIKS